jgi:hypothetical protein
VLKDQAVGRAAELEGKDEPPAVAGVIVEHLLEEASEIPAKIAALTPADRMFPLTYSSGGDYS